MGKQTESIDNSLFQHFLSSTGYTENELNFRTHYGIDNPAINTRIFSSDKFGNIKIPYYTIEGEILKYSNGDKLRDFQRIRLKEPKNDGQKYSQPKGSGSQIYFPPYIIEKYRNQEETPILHITEGEKKALAGCKKLNLPFVSIPGIHGFKETDFQGKKINNDLEKLIVKCNIKTLVFHMDADALLCKYDINNPDKDL